MKEWRKTWWPRAVDCLEKIGWVIVGVGCAKMGWWGPDLLFGDDWGTLAIGSALVVSMRTLA